MEYEERTPTAEELYSSPSTEELARANERRIKTETKLFEPEAAKSFKELTRDLTLSNLNSQDVEYVRLASDVIQHLRMLQSIWKPIMTANEEKEVERYIGLWEGSIAALANSKRGKDGFAFDGMTKASYELSQKYKQPKKEKTGLGRVISTGAR